MSEATALLHKASETLVSAEILLEAERTTDCVSRAYYAMYQATQSLLLAHGYDTNTHRGARMIFGKHFVKTKKIDRRFAVSLREAFDARLLADYSGESVSRDQAQETLSDAQAFVAEIERQVIDRKEDSGENESSQEK